MCIYFLAKRTGMSFVMLRSPCSFLISRSSDPQPYIIPMPNLTNFKKKFDEESAKHQTQISRLHNILRDEALKAEQLQQLYNAEQVRPHTPIKLI